MVFWALLLGMCAAEYLATVAASLSQHFVTESICLLATYLAMLILLNREPQASSDAEPIGEGAGGAEAAAA